MSATTTVQALQQALTPKTGMQRIPLAMETYQHQSVPLSSKLLLNMFAEQEPSDARVAAALLPTPGLSDWLDVGTGPIHAINDDDPGAIYVVSGTHFYLVTPGTPSTVTDLGDIGTPSGGFGPDGRLYSIAVGPTAAVVCSPPNAFVSVGGAPVAQITTTWPTYGASSVTFLDGYYVFTGQMSPQFFFITTLADPTMVDALDFAALDAFPNAVTKVMTLGTDLWFAGASGWEIWYDAGNQDFPFRRRPNGILQRSVGAATSIAKGDRSLWWWSADGRIYRTVGYQEQRVSTHGIEASITGGITSAYVYNLLGHICYVLNLGGRTLVYDALTGVWHSAASSTDGTGSLRGSCCTANTGFPIIGDATAGRLLAADPNLSTDMGVAVQRQVVLPPLYAGTRRAFCARLEVEMEVGTAHSPDSILLEWSDDGGITYTGSRAMTVGAAGTSTRKRVYTTRLGSFRNRVFRLTSHQAMTIYALDADITAGAH
jgi:hypothetical protein